MNSSGMLWRLNLDSDFSFSKLATVCGTPGSITCEASMYTPKSSLTTISSTFARLICVRFSLSIRYATTRIFGSILLTVIVAKIVFSSGLPKVDSISFGTIITVFASRTLAMSRIFSFVKSPFRDPKCKNFVPSAILNLENRKGGTL